jgi:hypothetical protein
LVRTGGSKIGRRKPKKEPATLRGREIRNQIRTIANMVPMGTAPEECAAIRKKFRKMNVPKTMLWISICNEYGNVESGRGGTLGQGLG